MQDRLAGQDAVQGKVLRHNTAECGLQVRWQATQFLLRRLAHELVVLNAAFLRLSVLLPPTRWESRLRKWREEQAGGLQEPLLPDGQV